MKRIIAILIAAALLLTSCGIIFRNEIREIFKDFFVSLTYETDDMSEDMIEEVYTLSYVPEGYTLEKESATSVRVKYNYKNISGETLCFEQRSIISCDYYIDSESGYSKIEEIEKYAVYYRFTNKSHLYVWSNEKYLINIKSSAQLSNEEIVLLLDGIIIK